MNNDAKGLKYRAVDAECCEVAGKGICFRFHITVPAMHKGLLVTGIGASAFENKESVERIVIPEGVTYIAENAFKGCKELMSVTLPATLQTIGEGAFFGCAALMEIRIPENVKEIAASAFEGCVKLKSATLSHVQTIRRRAFANCKNLDGLDLRAATAIGNEAFLNCTSLVDVTAPEQPCNVSVCAFEKCSKRGLGALWIGNRYIDRLTEAAFKDDGELRSGVYELFRELTATEDPYEIREMFRIYEAVMTNVASEGLDKAYCITYLGSRERENLAKTLFDDGYGKALHKLLLQAGELYNLMGCRATPVGPGNIGPLVRRLKSEPNRLQQASDVKAKANVFGEMLEHYHPLTGDIGSLYQTSSVDFAYLMESMDEMFNSAYTYIYTDAYKVSLENAD